MAGNAVTKQTLQRLPLYLDYLKSDSGAKNENISATMIAEALKINDVVVRKDLSAVSSSGKPKVGYVRNYLISELEDFLGCHKINNAIIAGAGKLGCALLSYGGFRAYGLNIIAAFDNSEAVLAGKSRDPRIFPAGAMQKICAENRISIGIITVPAQSAQQVCDQMIENKIRAIWNFAPTHLHVPNNILVQNENMASSLALLSYRLTEALTPK